MTFHPKPTPTMTNPQDINTKYPTIPFGYFQGMITSIESMENNIADAQDKLISTLMKPKSRLELCEIVNYTFDNEIGECEIYYRATGESDMPYMIEAVKQSGRDVRYSGRQEQWILDWLEERFPVVKKLSPLSPPDWWLDNYTDASGNCYSDADEGL